MTYPPEDLADAMREVEDRGRKDLHTYVEWLERQYMMWMREAERMRQLARTWEDKYGEEYKRAQGLSSELVSRGTPSPEGIKRAERPRPPPAPAAGYGRK